MKRLLLLLCLCFIPTSSSAGLREITWAIVQYDVQLKNPHLCKEEIKDIARTREISLLEASIVKLTNVQTDLNIYKSWILKNCPNNLTLENLDKLLIAAQTHYNSLLNLKSCFTETQCEQMLRRALMGAITV